MLQTYMHSHQEFHVLHLLIYLMSILCHNPLLHLLPQDGWTAVLVASHYGHKGLVQELCETFGADFLHRMKVRAMQTVSGRER